VWARAEDYLSITSRFDHKKMTSDILIPNAVEAAFY
jgi:hypothetical protein